MVFVHPIIEFFLSFVFRYEGVNASMLYISYHYFNTFS